ncbi:MAG: AAA family ATPase [bacterium]|nr:AAA family ATPase [bacterium]
MSKRQIQEIEILIRARYPILYIVTWEEDRVESALLSIVKSRDKKLYTWTINQGLIPYGVSAQAQKYKNVPTSDPLLALDAVIESVEPAIFLFKDFHSFINEATVKRKLREVSNYLRNSYKTLVLVAPVLTLPPELEKDITVIDFDLPTLDELSELLDRVLADLPREADIRFALEPETREKILHAALGLTIKEAENVFAKTIVQQGKLDEESITEIFSEKQQIIRKSGLLEYYAATENFNEVGGLDALKEWLHTRRLAFSEQARSFGLPAPKGVLFIGVQGCGKSLSAKAVSALWKVPLLRLDMGRLFGSLVGSSEDNVRRAIKVAESVSPTILWIDEIDKSFAGIHSSSFSDAGTTARVFGTFTTWLQEKTAPVFVIATANNITQLPPELLRKGRFDEIFFIDLPNFWERSDIFRIHLAKRNRIPEEFDIEQLAQATEGFSGAEIEQVIISALYEAFAAHEPLTTALILHNIKETMPLSKTMREEIEQLRQWAEGRARRASSITEPEQIKKVEKRKLEL